MSSKVISVDILIDELIVICNLGFRFQLSQAHVGVCPSLCLSYSIHRFFAKGVPD
jgi:hypothetical protein